MALGQRRVQRRSSLRTLRFLGKLCIVIVIPPVEAYGRLQRALAPPLQAMSTQQSEQLLPRRDQLIGEARVHVARHGGLHALLTCDILEQDHHAQRGPRCALQRHDRDVDRALPVRAHELGIVGVFEFAALTDALHTLDQPGPLRPEELPNTDARDLGLLVAQDLGSRAVAGRNAPLGVEGRLDDAFDRGEPTRRPLRGRGKGKSKSKPYEADDEAADGDEDEDAGSDYGSGSNGATAVPAGPALSQPGEDGDDDADEQPAKKKRKPGRSKRARAKAKRDREAAAAAASAAAAGGGAASVAPEEEEEALANY